MRSITNGAAPKAGLAVNATDGREGSRTATLPSSHCTMNIASSAAEAVANRLVVRLIPSLAACR